MDDDCVVLEPKDGLPFVRFIDKPIFVNGYRSGKTYFVKDSHGIEVEIGSSVSRGTNHLVYSASPKFLNTYKDMLRISEGCVTEYLKQFEIWVHKQIYMSFAMVSRSHKHTQRFMKKCDGMQDALQVTLMPMDYCSRPGVRIPNGWVLLKVGRVSFPVRVIQNVLDDGWEDFKMGVGLNNDSVLIFEIEREWVIDVIVLNKELEVVHGEWFDRKYRHRNVAGKNCLGSMYLPSFWIWHGFVLKFGHCYEGVGKLAEVLLQKLSLFNEEFQEAENIRIVAGHWTWEIRRSGGGLNVDCLGAFVKMTKLRVGDFLYFGVEDLQWVYVLMFDDEGDEFSYDY